MTRRKFHKSDTDIVLAGVCGGLAEFLRIDATIVRLSVVFVALVTAVIPVVLVYIVAIFIVPAPPVVHKDARVYDQTPE
jgi:phage shock protein C